MAPNAFYLVGRTIFWAFVTLPVYLLQKAFASQRGALKSARVHIEDFTYVILNTITPNLKKGTVIKKGLPGYGGIWPPYIAPTETDARAPCPGLSEYSPPPDFSRGPRSNLMFCRWSVLLTSYDV